jgi:hypothetical protein
MKNLLILFLLTLILLVKAEAETIESRIDGDFEGWEGGTTFKLTNGQLWRQVGHEYNFSYNFNPKVTIVSTQDGYQMQVEGMNKKISVVPIKTLLPF